MKRFSLKARLIFAVAAMSLLLVGIGYIGYRGLVDGEERLREMYQHQVSAMYDLHVVNAGYGARLLFINGEVADGRVQWKEGRQLVQEGAAKAAKAWIEYGETHMPPEERSRFEALRPRVKALEASVAKLWPLYDREDAAGLRVLIADELRPMILPAANEFLWLTDFQSRSVEESIAAFERADGLQKLELLGGVTVGLVLAVILGLYLSRMAGDLSNLVEQAKTGGMQVNTS
ncbi:MAG TPA: Tar ligand binding domain-containing protein, partial [Opitutaceae bacterium]